MSLAHLQVFQSLWAMQPHDGSGRQLRLDEICEMVAEAGFDGVAIDLGAADAATATAIRPFLEKAGLKPLFVAFPKSVEALRETLCMARDFGSPFVDVVGQVFPLTVEGAIPVIRRWNEMADHEEMPIQFETHRNCITNDLFFTLSLLDAVPEMRLSGDFSHYIVDREMRIPLNEVDRSFLTRCIERCDSFQGRVASRQQIQLQLDFPQHGKWLELFQSLWRQGFSSWKQRNPGQDMIFLCELGPPEYAMTDANGHEMSNRWEESCILKEMAFRIWSDLT